MFSRATKLELHRGELQDKINLLHHLYKPIDLNEVFYNSKVTAVRKLDYILKHTSRKILQDVDFKELLVAALTLVYFFGMRLRIRKLTSKCANHWFTKRDFRKAEAVFQKTMDMLLPERNEITIRVTLNFFTDASLWPFESFVTQILELILYFNKTKMTMFNLILTDIHYVLFSDVKSSRHRMRVLYELLNSNNWIIDKQKLLPFVTRLLDLFAHSLGKSESKMSYKYLRKGFEVCLRRIFERAENSDRLIIITTMLNWFSMVHIGDDDVLEFSFLLDRAAQLYQVTSYSDSFTEGLINHILRHLINSDRSLYSLIGCRLLQRFFDRHHNSDYLSSPTIFYDFSQASLVVAKYESGDKSFLRLHRQNIQKYFLRAIQKHCDNIINLKALYCVICIIILEVPCGLSAAMAACIVMTIQDFALNGENLAATSRYWMHSIVISVMSLICWVHKAPVLYNYINQIISRRAKEAPQLNPPLKHIYTTRQQRVTWNKPCLFLEDWELRYALWKHFQGRTSDVTSGIKMNTKEKIPTLEMI